MLDEVIACPKPDHGALVREGEGYVCSVCGARYEVQDGIPVLLPAGE